MGEIMFRIGRLAVAAFTLAAAAALPVVTAAPAQADSDQCLESLAEAGYAPASAELACELGELGYVTQCTTLLTNEDVPLATSLRACILAAFPELPISADDAEPLDD
jgi:hypothetical protein